MKALARKALGAELYAQVATAAEDECGAHGVPPSGLPGPCPCDRQAGATVIGETLGAARRSGW